MLRKIVKIDESRCNGCGQCVTSCAEGAIRIIGGKARLVSDNYCDGLGACLGTCPQDAITIEERDAAAFDEAAALAFAAANGGCHGGGAAGRHGRAAQPHGAPAFTCPGTQARQLTPAPCSAEAPGEEMQSELTHWPVQLGLLSPKATAFHDADLLLAADCVPFAFADFHRRFLRGRAVMVGCPKLDDAGAYVEKLTQILKSASVKSLTVVHMEVPCCSGLVRIAQTALAQSGKRLPLRDVTISIDGRIIAER